MTVYFNKKRGHWLYNFRLKGKRYSTYCLDAHGEPVRSRSAAVQAEGVAKRRAAMAGKVATAGEYTIAQAITELTPIWKRQDDWKNKRRYIKELLAFFGALTAAAVIDDNRIQDYVAFSLQQPVRLWIGGPAKDGEERTQRSHKKLDRLRSPATVNLYLHCLRQIIGRASKVRDGLTGESAVPNPPTVPVLKTAKRRARPVPDAVLTRVLESMRQHAAEAVRLTLYFGFRQGEVFGLRKHQVDFHANGIRLYAEDVKDEEDEFLHGSPEGMAFVRELVRQADGRGTDYLITVREGNGWQPIKSPKTGWKTAMNAVQKEFGTRWRWHDIRAAYITHVAMTSGPVAARRMARHADYKTTDGYVQVADELLREAARRAAHRPALAVVGSEKSQTSVANAAARLKSGKRQAIDRTTRPRSSVG